MNKKVLTLSAVMASMLFGAAAHAADTRIGVTIYKYDDNFMSVVRKAIEQDAKAAPDVQLLMNDSQNDQSKHDAMAMGAVEALKAHNKSSIPVFGVDALPEALALVKSGALAGTVLNDANNQAKATFDLAKNLADGKGAADGTNWKIDNKVVRVPYVGVDKDNLAEFSKK
ncbi:TPA: substrate-binding domain-containing protein [Escherichia coli]|nr:substrate-binding domain-containing protein [Escherichia coli]